MELKNCSKCGKTFTCKNDEGRCWCNEHFLSLATLEQLRKDFDNCLCQECLKAYAIPEVNN